MTPATYGDSYSCYTADQCSQALSQSPHCLINRDYSIRIQRTGHDVVVLSIHGGYIEVHTSEIARALAARFQWNHYDFNAHASPDCLDGANHYQRLHITSTHFDEAQALKLVASHPKTLSIHGYSQRRRTHDNKKIPIGTLCIGGSSATQRGAFIEAIQQRAHEFTEYALHAIDASLMTNTACKGLAGISPSNITNKNPQGKGLQIELSKPLRQHLTQPLERYHQLRDIIFNATKTALDQPP